MAADQNQTRAYVDPDQADPKNAVERIAEDMTDVERRHAPSLDRDKAVQKRMGRFARNLNKQFDQRLADREAEWQRERTELTSRLDRLEGGKGGPVDTDEARHKAEMDALEVRQAAAFESGDSAKAAAIGREMAAKEGAFWNAKTAAQVQGRRPEQQTQDPAQKQDLTGTRYAPTEAGRAFVAKQPWWNDPDFEAEKAVANALYRKLIDEGEDSGTNEFYALLSSELTKKMPHMADELEGVEAKDEARAKLDEEDFGEDEPAPAPVARRRAPVQHNPDRGDTRVARRRSGIALDESDMRTMRSVGLDPSNDKHLAQFAKSKRETAEAMRNSR